MALKELVKIINNADTYAYQTIKLFKDCTYVCTMRGDSEIINIYEDYTVVSLKAIADEEFKVNIERRNNEFRTN